MNRAAKAITSFEMLITGMTIFTLYRYVEVQALFYRYLPLGEEIKRTASLLVAFVVVTSLLLFSSHLERFKSHKYDNGKWIKNLLFTFTLFINFFFWQAWSADGASTQLEQILTLIFKNTIVIFFSSFDYAFNHLFTSIWSEQKTAAKNHQIQFHLEGKLSELKQSISEHRAKLSDLISREDPRSCPRCLKTFETANHRNGHLRVCKEEFNLKINNNE